MNRASCLWLCWLALACQPPEAQPVGPTLATWTPLGAAADRWVVSPAGDDRVAAVWGNRAFVRHGPEDWRAIPADDVQTWGDAETTTERLATGTAVLAAVLPSGLRVAATDLGLIEGPTLRGVVHPIGLPLPVRAGALDPKGSGKVLLAGDPAGLFRCEPATASGPASCETLDRGAFHSVRWFDDGTWILGTADGFVWRHTADAGFHRVRLGTAPIIDVDGVPDGGPRYATTKSGERFRSDDVGTTWTLVAEEPRRIGSGGASARITAGGELQVGPFDGDLSPTAMDLHFDPAATLRWASLTEIVVGVTGSTLVIEHRRQIQRRFTSDPSKVLLDARTTGEALQLLYADRLGASVHSVGAKGSLSQRPFGATLRDTWTWVLLVIVVLMALGWAFTHGPFSGKSQWPG